ncbi:hypothetical protein SLOPH_2364 [Spraguea lophii 42_110]|uniref:Trafficking protein particle complex subunit n=1 Tax=Spraguea lophii (strain 42_110) TaxID=1358809 RepID=S7W913_SPRLO|nr:hypothetical protein SLOPH_2364 [Spraguea lophii 42_110]
MEYLVITDTKNDIIYEHPFFPENEYILSKLRLLVYSSIDIIEEYRNGIIDYYMEYEITLYIMNCGYKIIFVSKWEGRQLKSFVEEIHKIFKNEIIKPLAPEYINFGKIRNEISIKYNEYKGLIV